MPSPSAVLVLVGAAAIGQAWFGVVLVVAYGAGLALTLVLIGLLVVGSGRVLAQRLMARAASAVRIGDENGKGRLVRGLAGMLVSGRLRALMPMGTAAMVILIGMGLVLRSLPAAIV